VRNQLGRQEAPSDGARRQCATRTIVLTLKDGLGVDTRGLQGRYPTRRRAEMLTQPFV